MVDEWGDGDGTEEGKFIYPGDLDVDASGNIFVADTLNYRIQSYVGIWNAYDGRYEGGMHTPLGIEADDAGHVYVADTLNHRILKYEFALTRCGNGTVQWKLGEQCEPGVGNECGVNAECTNECVCVPLEDHCGDGIIQWKLGETCDPPGSPCGAGPDRV